MTRDHMTDSTWTSVNAAISPVWRRRGVVAICVAGGLVGCSSMNSRLGLSSLMPHSVTTGQSEPDVDYAAERAAQAREEQANRAM